MSNFEHSRKDVNEYAKKKILRGQNILLEGDRSWCFFRLPPLPLPSVLLPALLFSSLPCCLLSLFALPFLFLCVSFPCLPFPSAPSLLFPFPFYPFLWGCDRAKHLVFPGGGGVYLPTSTTVFLRGGSHCGLLGEEFPAAYGIWWMKAWLWCLMNGILAALSGACNRAYGVWWMKAWLWCLVNDIVAALSGAYNRGCGVWWMALWLRCLVQTTVAVVSGEWHCGCVVWHIQPWLWCLVNGTVAVVSSEYKRGCGETRTGTTMQTRESRRHNRQQTQSCIKNTKTPMSVTWCWTAFWLFFSGWRLEMPSFQKTPGHTTYIDLDDLQRARHDWRSITVESFGQNATCSEF